MSIKRAHLSLDLQSMHMAGVTGHAQRVMEDLGITYQHATPQTMGDCWWFWNCEYDCELPSYISVRNFKPLECVGRGLSQESANTIHDYQTKNPLNQSTENS